MTDIHQDGTKGYATGRWAHLFGPGSRDTQCRVLISLEKGRLIAAQEWTGQTFVDLYGDRFRDLAESVIDVNEAHLNPLDWELVVTAETPQWAVLFRHEAKGSDQRSTQLHVAQEHPCFDVVDVQAVAGLRSSLLGSSFAPSALPAELLLVETSSMDLSKLDDFALISELQRRGRLVQSWCPSDLDPVMDEDLDVLALALTDEQREAIQDRAFDEACDDLDGIVISRGNEYLSDWWAMNKHHYLPLAVDVAIEPDPCSGS